MLRLGTIIVVLGFDAVPNALFKQDSLLVFSSFKADLSLFLIKTAGVNKTQKILPRLLFLNYQALM